jgi:glycosyltransferase involved in cell wall biosynthesis
MEQISSFEEMESATAVPAARRSGTEPIHVLFMIDELVEMGGAERALIRMIHLLPHDKFRATAITFRADEGQPLVINFPCPLTIIPLGRTYSWNALQVARKIRNYIRQRDVRIVHTFFETSDLWGGLVAKSTGRVALISNRRDMGILRSAKHRFGYQLLNRMFDRVITVSERVRQYCLEVDRLLPEKVVTVYTGIEDRWTGSAGRSHVRASLGLSNKDLVVTTVGHIRRVKGIDILAAAAARLKDRFPNAQFLIVGDAHEPEHMSELQKFVARNQLEREFHFVGPREDIPSILDASDVFVLPSRSEGFSNALVKAMLCRLPCVATDVGGNKEALHDGENGYLVPNESVERMVEAIAFLLEDGELRNRMGNESRRIALEAFALERMMQGLIEVYKAALQEREKHGDRNFC